MDNKLAGALGLCRRAGHLIAGFDATKEWIKSERAVLVLLAQDLSEKTEKEIRFCARSMAKPPLLLPCSMQELSAVIGMKKPVGVIAVDDNGLATAICKHIPAELKEDDAL